MHTVARESICTVLQKNFSQLENPAFGRSLRAHNGLYKWAISFFNRVRNFNFHSFFDENNPNHKNDIPLPIYSRKYFAKFLELYPKEYIYIYISLQKILIRFPEIPKSRVSFSSIVFIIYSDRSNTFVSHCTRTRGSCRPHSTEIPRGPPPRPSFKPFQGCCIRLDGYNAGTATAQWLRNSCERCGEGEEERL